MTQPTEPAPLPPGYAPPQYPAYAPYGHVELVPASYAEKAMASIMQLHQELMDEKERRVDLFRRLMEREQALAELRAYVTLLEQRAQPPAPVEPVPIAQVASPQPPPPPAVPPVAPVVAPGRRPVAQVRPAAAPPPGDGWKSW